MAAPSVNLAPSTSLAPNQPHTVMPWLQYTTDDAGDTDPLWRDATAYLRGFDSKRGRADERSLVDAGTVTFELSARDRVLDPTENTLLEPMNRWKLSAQFGSKTEMVFLGYADSYDLSYPQSGKDSIVTVACSDEFKVLALDNLPTTDPPRDTYGAVVMFDQPSGYWRMDDDPAKKEVSNAAGGSSFVTSVTALSHKDTPIVGDAGRALTFSGSGAGGFNANVEANDGLNPAGLAEITLEAWVQLSDTTPASGTIFLNGSGSAGGPVYWLQQNAAGTLSFSVRNASGGAIHTVTSGTLADATWYYVVGTISGGLVRLYVNGSQVDATTWTGGTFGALDPAVNFIRIMDPAAFSISLDELAFYRYGLTAARIAAHYTAGTQRGFAYGQWSRDRVIAVLDAAGSSAPRTIDANNSRFMAGRYMHGQAPLDELRAAELAEAPDGILFISRRGAVTFLTDVHRGFSPYTVVQATFDDDGTDLGYRDASVGKAEAFLVNEWTATRVGGTLVTVRDQASIDRRFKRSRGVGEIPVTEDVYVTSIVTRLLEKYKDPLSRIPLLTLTTDRADVADAALSLDIGDRIRIFRRPLGGGSAIDQEAFVQSIQVNGEADPPIWTIRLGVSPV